MKHCSTPQQRVTWSLQLLTSPTHGQVSQLSREHQVSRQSLYRWKWQAQQALHTTFASDLKAEAATEPFHREVLTLLVEAHASYRQIQSCLHKLLGISLSLGTICRIVQQAGKRARVWLGEQASASVRSLALDEQFSNTRGQAYLNAVDVHSGQVWASLPPTAVEGESWMIVLWDLQAQGVSFDTLVSDGGHAIHDALKQMNLLDQHQRDVWHVFAQAAKVQARLETHVQHEEERLRSITAYQKRTLGGQKCSGRPPKTSQEEQERLVKHLMSVWEAVAYLFGELHRLLEVVIVDTRSPTGLMTAEVRQQELETVVSLLKQVQHQVPTSLQHDLASMTRVVELGLPSLLRFASGLEERHQQAVRSLGGAAIGLIAWAWQRRRWLGPDTATLLNGLAPAWRETARMLFESWNGAVRASSVVENWHSLVRPHLAVHRSLSAELLALLAVWHNHRVAPRGLHEGRSPLQRSEPSAQSVDWLTALGYLPKAA